MFSLAACSAGTNPGHHAHPFLNIVAKKILPPKRFPLESMRKPSLS